jgi:RNA polymerase sigma-70 factor (ECF subfamily)
MTAEQKIAEAWRANHAYLVNLAFGILGDLGLAEDAVQEAFARLLAAGDGEVRDERGWLIVVTSRICFDKVRAAPHRRERPDEGGVLESAPGIGQGPDGAGPDPADRITLDDEVRLALLVVLERLSPAERVVFVLHDIFQLPFDAISDTVGRPAATCRQLARRARLKLAADDGQRRFTVADEDHLHVTTEFIDACATGDLAALLELLDPDVAGDIDLGPLDPRSGRVNRGSAVVGPTLLRYFGPQVTLVAVPGGGPPLVLAFIDGRLNSLLALRLSGDRIRHIHVLADPQKMALLGRELSLTA